MAEPTKIRTELDVPAEVISGRRAYVNEAMLRLARLIGRQMAREAFHQACHQEDVSIPHAEP